MTESKEFCQNLRLLSSYEASIAALCRKLSFNRQQFNKYLAGSVFPSRRNLRRICEDFGVTDSEILMPHHNFSELVSLKPRKDKARDNSPEGTALHRSQANSRAVPDRYLGLYFLYSPSFAYRGLFTRSLVSIFRHDGVVYWKNIEYLRRRDRDEPVPAVSKYIGILCMVGDRLQVLEEEVIFQNVLSQTILYPSFTKQVRHLVGIHTSIADLNRRTPAASRVVLEFLGRSVELCATLRKCGQYPAAALPALVLENLVSTRKTNDGTIEASADGPGRFLNMTLCLCYTVPLAMAVAKWQACWGFLSMAALFRPFRGPDDIAVQDAFSPCRLRGLTLPNRILSSAHGTYMLKEALQADQITLYRATRAAGGVGPIILEATSVHAPAIGGPRYAVTVDHSCIPGYRKVFDAIHARGTAAFVQLDHPGRDDIAGGTTDGTIAPCYSSSAVRCEANQLMPRAMSALLIEEVVEGYGTSARRLITAGADGIEISAHHGHLIARFLDPRVNKRSDGYSGSFANRFRVLSEIVTAVRTANGPDKVLGVRLPTDEMSAAGIPFDEALQAIEAINALPEVDFIHVTPGSTATFDGTVHVAPPMAFAAGYLSPPSARKSARP